MRKIYFFENKGKMRIKENVFLMEMVQWFWKGFSVYEKLELVSVLVLVGQKIFSYLV